MSLQERLHYETLSQHLGKLGEDAGKMVHRVIDLTRPEDLDGGCLFFLFFLTSIPLFTLLSLPTLGSFTTVDQFLLFSDELLFTLVTQKYIQIY